MSAINLHGVNLSGTNRVIKLGGHDTTFCTTQLSSCYFSQLTTDWGTLYNSTVELQSTYDLQHLLYMIQLYYVSKPWVTDSIVCAKLKSNNVIQG